MCYSDSVIIPLRERKEIQMKLKKALALLLAFCLIVPTPITSRAEESSAEQTSQSVTTETEDVKENLKSETDSENASNSQN